MSRQITVAEFFTATTAWIDYNEFEPLSDQEWELMWRCTAHVGFLSLWVPGSEHTFSLPEKAQRLVLNAIDHMERGYCIEICWARHPDWPNRTFTYVVAQTVPGHPACDGASKISKQFIYEVPTGDPVPLTVLLKKIAECQQFWSWRSWVGKISISVSIFYVIAGLGMLFSLPARDDDSFWLRVAVSLLVGVVVPALQLTWPKRSVNRDVAKTKEMASKL